MFSPQRLSDPARTAKQLGCSTDYLLGLTDELTPAAPVKEKDVPAEEIHPVWLPGKPEKSGPVAARFHLPEGGSVMTDLVWFDADFGKYRFSQEGAAIDAECTGWWPVPGKEDDHADEA